MVSVLIWALCRFRDYLPAFLMHEQYFGWIKVFRTKSFQKQLWRHCPVVLGCVHVCVCGREVLCQLDLLFSLCRHTISFSPLPGCLYNFPYCLFIFWMFTYLFLRESERARRGGAEREGDRRSKTGSTLSVQSPTQGSSSWAMRSWPELKLDT